jgi:hypothetical protein
MNPNREAALFAMAPEKPAENAPINLPFPKLFAQPT